ncbi:MAG: hypothetical protein QOD75_2717 [Blastocatellia bacterium]|nr:hypothetical protein [Blastocatellia bacterium]
MDLLEPIWSQEKHSGALVALTVVAMVSWDCLGLDVARSRQTLLKGVDALHHGLGLMRRAESLDASGGSVFLNLIRPGTLK